jgi:hypothetical protein
MVEFSKLKVKEILTLKKFDASNGELMEIILLEDGKIIDRITEKEKLCHF